jgi:hypothetical protein
LSRITVLMEMEPMSIPRVYSLLKRDELAGPVVMVIAYGLRIKAFSKNNCIKMHHSSTTNR